MPEHGRPRSFAALRGLPGVGRVLDWGLGPSAVSRRTARAGARIAGLKVTESVCPYCAVGCGQLVYTRDGELVDIEGNPRSPINQGTLCPKGSASRQLVQQPGRLTKVRYRRPGRHRVGGARARDGDGHDRRARDRGPRATAGRTPTTRAGASTARSGFAHLGGATLDNEENYLIKKAFTAMGAVQIENQARI